MAYICRLRLEPRPVAEFLHEKPCRPAGEWDQWRRMDRLSHDADREMPRVVLQAPTV